MKTKKTNYILTTATDAVKRSLTVEGYRLCRCCDFEGTIWLSPLIRDGRVSIHGIGYDDGEMFDHDATPKDVAWATIMDMISHGQNVFLTPDINEFIRCIARQLLHEKAAVQRQDGDF